MIKRKRSSKIEVASYKGRRWPVWVKALALLVLAGALSFGGLLTAVLGGAHSRVAGDPQVMVILGCQVRRDGPSQLLADRLDTALNYLEDHPDMTVVVSGGQGPDEPTTEARAMADYLIAAGFPEEQIVLEDRSHSTWENIQFTLELLQTEEDIPHVGEYLLVSNGFHLTRARMLWNREWPEGCTLSTLAAPSSHLPSRLKMYIREPLALAKSFLFDR